MRKWKDLLDRILAELDSQSEAEQIVIAAAQKFDPESGMQTRSDLYFRLNDCIGGSVSRQLSDWALVIAGERKRGQLLQHLIGYQNFLGSDYLVARDTLIPRPETEILVVEVVQELEKLRLARGGAAILGYEIGVGSGIISIELLKAFHGGGSGERRTQGGFKLVASDLCEAVLALTAKNADRVLGDTTLVRGYLELVRAEGSDEVFEPLSRWRALAEKGEAKVDFIVSNPPYLQPQDTDADVLSQEPHSALFAHDPKRPDYFYEVIAEQAGEFLADRGFIAVEIPHERVETIESIFKAAGWSFRVVADLTSRPRVLIARR